MHSKYHITLAIVIAKHYLCSPQHIIVLGWCLYWVSGKSKGHKSHLKTGSFPHYKPISQLWCGQMEANYELINLQGKISGGQRRGNGGELSIWDYPDLMGGIKRPVGGNPLSIPADFVTSTCDVILQEPFRRSGCWTWIFTKKST